MIDKQTNRDYNFIYISLYLCLWFSGLLLEYENEKIEKWINGCLNGKTNWQPKDINKRCTLNERLNERLYCRRMNKWIYIDRMNERMLTSKWINTYIAAGWLYYGWMYRWIRDQINVGWINEWMIIHGEGWICVWKCVGGCMNPCWYTY